MRSRNLGKRTRLDYLKEAAEEMGKKVIVDDQGIDFLANEDEDLVFSDRFGFPWGLNSYQACLFSNSKDVSYERMKKSGVKFPNYFSINAKGCDLNLKNVDNFIEDAINFSKICGFPLIIKPNAGSRGVGVLLIEDEWDLVTNLPFLLEKYGNLILQHYISEREYRVVILDGEVVFAFERAFSKEHPLKRDTRFDKVVSDVADLKRQTLCSAMDSIGLDYAGIDVLTGDLSANDDSMQILELNCFPMWENAERLRGPDFVRVVCRKLLEFTFDKYRKKGKSL